MFNFYTKKNALKIQPVDNDNNNKNVRNSEQFCFNDLQEFMLYTALYKNGDKDIVWLKSDEYDKYWNDGFKLFDEKKYEAAIKSYQKCLNMNPISLYVKFEIAECYIQLKNYPAAMNMLMENVKHLMSDKHIAQFYRRIGFINIEVGNYDCEHYIKMKQYQVKERSTSQIRQAFYNHINPVIGDLILFEINTIDIIKVLDRLKKKKLAKSSIKNVCRHMNAMFNFAREEGMIIKNPMYTIKVEAPRQSKRKDLDDNIIKLILDYGKEYDYKIFIMLSTLLTTGIRVGELCAIKWDDFDINFDYIRINESLTDYRFENTTKTENSERDIPLNDFLQTEYKKMYLQRKQISPDVDNEYVFLNKRGRPYNSSTFDKRFKFLKELITDKTGIDITYVTPHYFRHTFATKGLQNGVDIKDMQELMGHANAKTLLQVYSHTNTQRKIKSMEKINNSISYAF